MRAVQVTEFGGPEVLNLVDLPDPVPGPGQLVIEVDRIGVNYADTHQAENSYLAPSKLPLVPGGEVVGRTSDGKRVVALLNGGGGYAERAVADEATTFGVPDGVDDLTALSFIVQGTTAAILLRKNAHLEPGESVVVHAAAGGVGSIAVQLAKAWGASRVIATASSDEKRALALDLGADVAIDSRAENMTDALREANGGKRVDVVLDMAGGSVTDQSIAALAPFGRLAFYGMASRQQPKPIETRNLLGHSTTVSGMWLPHVFKLRGNVFGRALDDLFSLALAGQIRAVAGGEYALSDARAAHEALRSRGTSGKLLLDPGK
ncbi:quinone oxidoreductase family protein [Amycolatopsis regifaucium]|uniref:NADPH:quinone reductase n=1 Tax=Amycolatopsis regifaucium TaxID=546365 RepID=A0A154MTA5_9PSEU|nr:NADPH:quinone oxidoreductase family protein [Amycolatopsis regifaucium]KZB87495.1 NADPH:quinone reductase [Amycolatopsis regifaucium]OKA08328.1 NADPH:quinone reductase [Amycolatopsis regifaucium]SFI07120.1 NADPH2:quinone reductase [Amycolatopsis regifaucium]